MGAACGWGVCGTGSRCSATPSLATRRLSLVAISCALIRTPQIQCRSLTSLLKA